MPVHPKGGRGWTSEEERHSIGKYIAQIPERFLKTAWEELEFVKKDEYYYRKKKGKMQVECLRRKVLHGQFVKDTEGYKNTKWWECL